MKILQKISQFISSKFKKKPEKIFEKSGKIPLAIFIGGALAIASIMVGVSLWMYEEFGTAQLDLSRPSLQEARDQAKKQADREKLEQAQREAFETEGAIDSKTLEKFEKLYSNEMEKLNGEFFTVTDLSDETLNLTDEKQGENQ
ncbi:MAG: hypothetical protein WAV68_01485 [Candidatus Nanogingivalis sp.]